jgi:hypothetical protein
MLPVKSQTICSCDWLQLLSRQFRLLLIVSSPFIGSQALPHLLDAAGEDLAKATTVMPSQVNLSITGPGNDIITLFMAAATIAASSHYC